MDKISISGLKGMSAEKFREVRITDAEINDDGELIETIEKLSGRKLKEFLIEKVTEKGRPLTNLEFTTALKDSGIIDDQAEKRKNIIKLIDEHFTKREESRNKTKGIIGAISRNI